MVNAIQVDPRITELFIGDRQPITVEHRPYDAHNQVRNVLHHMGVTMTPHFIDIETMAAAA